MTTALNTRIQGGPRWRRIVAAVVAASFVATSVVVLSTNTPASAASYTFQVDSLSPTGNDLNPGDGICRTAANTCTLRAALQESNVLGASNTVTIAPAADVDSSTAGVQSTGTIVGVGPANTTNFMFVGTLTTQGDTGAYFRAAAPVTIDFQNRLGIASLNDADGATALYIDGPAVTVRNFSSIKSNETAIVVSGAGDGAVLENGALIDPGSINMERAVWLATGADNVTIRNVSMGSTYSGGGSAIRFPSGASITGLTLDRIRMYDPDTEAYNGIQAEGAVTLTNLTITGSTFENFQLSAVVLDLRQFTLNGARITGNKFTKNNTGGNPVIWLAKQGTGSPNVISNNIINNFGASANYGIYSLMGIAQAAQSGYRIEDNFLDGFTTNSIFLQSSGVFTVQRNTWGKNSANAGTSLTEAGPNAVDEETRHWAAYYNEFTTLTNSRISPWFPTSVSYNTTACTVTVGVTPPVNLYFNATIPTTPVTLDVYYTAVANGTNAYAEIYLGRQTGITAATSLTVPYTLGAGYIRLQTIDSRNNSSQYSRVFSQPLADTCAPRATVDQFVAQADPTSNRDIRYTVNLSEPIAASGAGSLQTTDFVTTGSTAPGVTVSSVTKLTDTSYEVVARANGSGTVVLSLPAGAVQDLVNNPSLASTSTDNSVTFVSPLTLSPTAVSVTEGAAAVNYTVSASISATAPIVVTPVSANTALATVSPSPLTIPTLASSGTIAVSAVNDAIVNGTRNTTVSHTVTSTDLNFNGLILPDVAVTVLDNDTPNAAQSSLGVTTGTVIADNSSPHTATATVKNDTGDLVQGATVSFSADTGPTLSSPTCVTGATGTCTVTLTSSVFGLFAVRATIGGTPITNSPASVRFGAGPASPANSTIAASPTSITADGTSTSTITVQAIDSLLNVIPVGGATVTMNATAGNLSAVTDVGNGTYTAVLTAPAAVSSATVSFTINSVAGTRTATVTFVAGVASPARSVIAATPTSITANGTSTSTITVGLRDANDNPTLVGGPVVIGTNNGSISTTTNNGDGTYSATLTSSTIAGSASLSFTVNGVSATNTATVQFTPGAASAATSTISAGAASLTADGASSTPITVRLKDAQGNFLTASGGTVVISTNAGNVTATTDNGNGTYSATLTSSTLATTAAVTFTLGGTAGTNQASVAFVAGAASAGTSTVAAAPTSIVANGISTSVITVQLRDAFNNPRTTGGTPVVISAVGGTVGATTDNGNGSYTATFTSGTAAGPATVSFTVNGTTATNQATVTLVAGAPSAATSMITATPSRVEANGTSTSLVTVSLKDAFGNEISSGAGATVTMSTTLGNLGTVTDVGNGTFTATLTSSLTVGVAVLSFTLNSTPGTNTQSVQFASGAASPTNSTIAAAPTSITANGATTSTVTVQLRDANNNLISASGGTVVINSSLGAVGPITDNADGTYTATVTSGTVTGQAAVSFSVNGDLSPNSATIAFTAGPLDLDRSTITSSLTSLPVGGTSTTTITVSLLDAFGNLMGVGGQTVVITPTDGTVGAVTDNGDGTYSVVLTSSDVATVSNITYTVGASPERGHCRSHSLLALPPRPRQ